MKTSRRSTAQRICLALALLCWIVAAVLAVLTVGVMNEPGMHGALQALSIIFGYGTLLAIGLGSLLYYASRCGPDLKKDP